jgi:hypothetical protein
LLVFGGGEERKMRRGKQLEEGKETLGLEAGKSIGVLEMGFALPHGSLQESDPFWVCTSLQGSSPLMLLAQVQRQLG